MKLKFSDRIGATNPSDVLQVESMNESLRNTIWNFINVAMNNIDSVINKVVENVCAGFFKYPLDELHWESFRKYSWLKEKYYSLKWYEVYNLLEYLQDKIAEIPEYDFREALNTIFENEMSGYRFIEFEIVPITNSTEIQCINDSIVQSKQNSLYGATKHFEAALKCFSLKPNPDYRNTIKESISAVESVIKQITNEKGGGLDKAITILDSKINFHGGFKAGLLSLYGYTSDEDGIRHSILKEKDIGFDEAKFMLVSCSALVNFLIAKAEKAGLLK